MHTCLVAQSCPTLCDPMDSLRPHGLFETPWTVAHQAPLSMGFSRQEYWSGLPFPSPGDLPNPGIKPASPMSPALQANSLPPAIGEAHRGSCHRCNTCDTGSRASLPRSPGKGPWSRPSCRPLTRPGAWSPTIVPTTSARLPTTSARLLPGSGAEGFFLSCHLFGSLPGRSLP